MIEFISQLPTEYQEVEYIQSSGTQYIDTGISPSENLITQVVFIPNASAMTEHAMFGSTWSANGYFMMFYQNSLRWHSGGKSVDVSNFETASKNTIICTHTGLTVNGTLHSISPTGSDSTNTIYLFATQGTMSGNKGIYKLVYCAMSLNGVLVREFIPCYRKADSVAGLYDLVNNVFYTNAGSGVFAVGANSNKHAIATITPGGVISFGAVLRRRMMVCSGPFSFEYTGTFTDAINGSNRIITLTSSGILTVKGSIAAEVYMLAGGGGAARNSSGNGGGTGGGGGNKVFTYKIVAGQYDITVGKGGNSVLASNGTYAGTGGDTSAFGEIVTGGTGGMCGTSSSATGAAGIGGTPNGGNGRHPLYGTIEGGSPNGGGMSAWEPQSGGDGYITLTIPI